MTMPIGNPVGGCPATEPQTVGRWGDSKTMRYFVVGAISICVLWLGIRIGYKQLVMKSWPTAEAEIIEWDPRIKPTQGYGWYANPHILFRYQVDQREITSARLNPSFFNYQSPARLAQDTRDFILMLAQALQSPAANQSLHQSRRSGVIGMGSHWTAPRLSRSVRIKTNTAQ